MTAYRNKRLWVREKKHIGLGTALENASRINTSKTKEMVISFSRNHSEISPVTVGGCQLQCADYVTLLGVQISSGLSCEKHVSQIMKKA